MSRNKTTHECKAIKGEFASNGVKNDLKHTKGVLSMARTMVKDSASSQFFIMHADVPHLDGDYAALGKVLEGLRRNRQDCERTDRHDGLSSSRCCHQGDSNRMMRIFIMPGCPHCAKLRHVIEDLCNEDPRYKNVDIEYIDETKEVELADSYDLLLRAFNLCG